MWVCFDTMLALFERTRQPIITTHRRPPAIFGWWKHHGLPARSPSSLILRFALLFTSRTPRTQKNVPCSRSLSNAQCSSGIISPWYAHLLSSSSLILHDWSLPAYLHHTAVGALSPPLFGLRPIIYNNTSSTTHVTLRRPLFS